MREVKKTYQDLESSKRIVPSLSVAVQRATAEDLDIVSTPAPKCD